jgi:dihydrodipicolinate synthase/N-acetylneuraminate lyase
VQALESYAAPSGLSIPLVTVFDRQGNILEDEQRALIRFAIQDGAGADVVFAAGTTGEWNRIDNRRRQLVCRITVEECARASAAGKKIEAWAGITAPTRAETLDNLSHALDIGADAAVLAPLSIADAGDPVDFVIREAAAVFEERARSIPVFLYDNADIAAPGKAPHMHTRDVKQMSRCDFVRGMKVTAGKRVLGNYMHAASNFKLAGEFAIYAGDPYLIFDLFAHPRGLLGTMRHRWNRYWTQGALPYGVVSGPANVMPREWKRAWLACRAGDDGLMARYAGVFGAFRAASAFERSGKIVRPTIACLKAALVEMGVCESDAVAPGTPELMADERREFARRFTEIRRQAEAELERKWLSAVSARPTPLRHRQII